MVPANGLNIGGNTDTARPFFSFFFCPVQRADENVIMLAHIHYLHTMEFGSGCWYVRGT